MEHINIPFHKIIQETLLEDLDNLKITLKKKYKNVTKSKNNSYV